MRALLLIKRDSSEGEDTAKTARDQLASHDVDVVLADFQKPNDVPAAIDSQADNVDIVVIGGGDGLLNLAADALIRAKRPLGVLPLGTANDFARTLMIPSDLEGACRNIVEGEAHAVDIGRCNDVYFVNVASIGLPVRAQAYRSDVAKRWLGSLGYASNVITAFRETQPFQAEIEFGDERRTLRTIQLAIGNGRYFGGGLAVSADASLDDGRLDFYSLDPQTLRSMIGKLPALVRGPDRSVQGVQLFTGTEFRIQTETSMSINTDGEVLTQTPATFRVLPRALTVKVPQAYLDRYRQPEEADAGTGD